MTNANMNTQAQAAHNFSRCQQQALTDWANNLSDYRLEVVRNQLMQAIASYNPDKDHVMVGLALEARREAVQQQIDSRGGVQVMNPVLIPWGKSLDDIVDWSLTDFTRLPPPEKRGIFIETQSRPLNLLLQPVHPFNTRNTTPAGEARSNIAHMIDSFQNMNENTMQDIDNIASQFSDSFVIVTELVNDYDEVEAFRNADNDLSGLPIVSCAVIDVHNTPGPADEPMEV